MRHVALRFALCALLLALVAQPARADSSLVLKALGKPGGDAVLVFIHGASLPGAQYTTLFTQLQQASPLNLWVVLPGFTLDTPNPLEIKSSTEAALKTAYSQGLSSSAPIFFGGHSLGAVMVASFVANMTEWAPKGMMLTGGFLSRANLAPVFNYPVPTLTLGGELDGLTRVTRIAESFYQCEKQQIGIQQFPVIVLPGVSHFQFAGEGPIPFLVKARDLMPEVTQEVAWQQIVAVFNDFMLVQLQQPGAGGVIATMVGATAKFVAPIIAAYEMEGSRHFNAPAQIGGPGASQCVQGGCPSSSAWPHVAQELIGANIPAGPDGSGFEVKASNQFVDCTSTPITGAVFHLPNVTVRGKTLEVTTYSQCNWDSLDNVDSGFTYTSATEIATKMYSRQCILINGAGFSNTTTDFNVTDAPQFCSQANALAYEWATQNAGAATLKRFQQYGEPMVMGNDIEEIGGPWFLFNYLNFTEVTDPTTQQKAIQVSAPMQKSSIDYWQKHFPFPRPSWIPDPGCFHYCKLLSPARVTEWMYVDGLRENRHI